MKHLNVFQIFHKINGTYNPPYTIRSITNIDESRNEYFIDDLTIYCLDKR